MVVNNIFKRIMFLSILMLSGTFLFAEKLPVIKDEADLLTEEQEALLYEDMLPIIEYGGVAFYTNDKSYPEEKASDLAKRLCNTEFEGESGVIFLIDMYTRQIEIYSTGYIYKVLGKVWANGIADNVYTYATDKDYYTCAKKTYQQMTTILSGGKVSVPMKKVSRLLLALALSFFLNFYFLYFSRLSESFGKKVSLVQMNVRSAKTANARHVQILSKKLIREKKVAHSSGSSGGSSGSHGGGHFSGGGHSSGGGGGGHGF